MDTKNVEQNLSFALLALKMGLIHNEAMVAALNAWSAQKERSVGRILVAQGALTEARFFLVESTCIELLEGSGGDPYQGMLALRLPAGLVETNLERIVDEDLRAALSRLEGAESGGRDGATVNLLKTDFDPQLAARDHRPAPAPAERDRRADALSQVPTQIATSVEPEATGLATGGWPRELATEPVLAAGSELPPGSDPLTVGLLAGSLPAVEETVALHPAPGPGRAVGIHSTQPENGSGLAATVDHEALESPGPVAARGASAPGSISSSPSRYRSLRPYAKGGLGEVFVAFDEELGREVALKEIQGRHVNHPESRARFLIEAEVTGGLEHPGIVPVYGLGQYPDGRPYYAMRFIRGGTLKQALDAYHDNGGRIPDPGQRTLALRGLLNRLIDVCHALAYAHARGILHRDIKPANIMLGAFGETLVVDWGLAKSVDRPETHHDPDLRPLRPLSAGASGSGTMYGSAVGTPNFMSPEQAGGEIDKLGPASDIYSIGATLYNILVGKPPFLEPQLAFLLNKVRQGKFLRPSAVDRRVPRALEAICLKAMALRPEDRYPSARALANDLESWLADEPVAVYREPWMARLARWARRHKTLVTTSAALVLTAFVALSIGTVLIQREKARTEVNFRLARDAVDQMLTRLGEVELADVPQMEPVRRTMLDKAQGFYQNFLAQRGHDRSIRQETGRANLRLGNINEMLGDYVAAEAAYNRAIALLAALVAEQPGMQSERRDLAGVQHKLGVLLKKSSRFTESEKALHEARRLRQELVTAKPDNPDNRRDLMDTVYQLGTVLARQGRVNEVEAAYAEAIDSERDLAEAHPDRPEYPRLLARYLNNRGMLLRSIKDDKHAEAAFKEALALQRPLAEKSPTVAGLQWERARTTSNLAAVKEHTQGAAQAVADYREARAQLKRLADDFPSVPDYQNELAVVSFNLGSTLLKQAGGGETQKDHDDADRLRNESSEPLDAAAVIYRNLIRPEKFPHRPDYRQKLAQAERKRGMLLASSLQTAEAETAFRAAVEELKELVRRYPQVPEYQSDLGVALQNLALNQLARKQPAQARSFSDESIGHHRVALKSNPKDPFSQQYLLDVYFDLEVALKQLGDHAGMAEAADELLRLLPDDPRATYRSARMLDASASLAAAAADIPEAKRQQVVSTRTERALNRLKQALREDVKVSPKELDVPAFSAIRAQFPSAMETLKKKLEARIKSVQG